MDLLNTTADLIPPPSGTETNFVNPAEAGWTPDQVGVLTCAVLATILVLFRFYVKIDMALPVMAEDCTCVAAWASLFAFVLTIILMPRYGQGDHAQEVARESYGRLQQWYWIRTLIYGPASFFVKTTILLFVARVFSVKTQIRKAICAFSWLLLGCYLALEAVKLFACRPIQAVWDESVKNEYCLDMGDIFIADAAFAMVSNTVVLIVTLSLAWSTDYSRLRRFGIAAVLGIGGLATALSCFQLYKYVYEYGPWEALDDPTADMMVVDLAKTTELTLGLTCACLPSLGVRLTFWRRETGLMPGARNSVKHEEQKVGASLSHLINTSGEVHEVSGAHFDVESSMMTGRPITMRLDELDKEQLGISRSTNSIDGIQEGWLAPDVQRSQTPSRNIVPDRIWDGLSRDRAAHLAMSTR